MAWERKGDEACLWSRRLVVQCQDRASSWAHTGKRNRIFGVYRRGDGETLSQRQGETFAIKLEKRRTATSFQRRVQSDMQTDGYCMIYSCLVELMLYFSDVWLPYCERHFLFSALRRASRTFPKFPASERAGSHSAACSAKLLLHECIRIRKKRRKKKIHWKLYSIKIIYISIKKATE